MRIPLVAISSVLVASALVAAGCSDDGGGRSSPFAPANDDDPADASDIDLGDIDLEDLTEGGLEDAMDAVQDLAEQLSGDGGGTVEFNGETIEFEAEFCFLFDDDFEISGQGTVADGTPVWVGISRTSMARAVMIEFSSEEAVELIYGDADPIITDDFSLEYGRDDVFDDGAADGLPDIYADQSTFEMDVSGGSATGSGTAVDFNGVLGDFGETLPFSFQVTCS